MSNLEEMAKAWALKRWPTLQGREDGVAAAIAHAYETGARAALDLPEVRAMLNSIRAYHEYFEAIEGGEYEANRRPAPLREFETVLQAKADSALAAFDKLLEQAGS